MADAALLKIGRHFRLSDTTKLILGRNKEENERLRALGKAGHLFSSHSPSLGLPH